MPCELQSYGFRKDRELYILDLAECVYTRKSCPDKLKQQALILFSQIWLLERCGTQRHLGIGSACVVEELERQLGFTH